MKKNIIIQLLIILTLPHFNYSYSKDLKVIDGDTIKINNKIIRFGGIDAPESYYRGKKQKCILDKKIIYCGDISKKKLEEKISDNKVTCINEKNKNIYNRIIAECFIGKESLSKYMVRSGYAFDYKQYSKGKYSDDEIYAKKNNNGMWKMKFDYPWIWRKNNK
mgnify:CR=1 FL=1